MSDGALAFCMVSTFYPPYNFGGDGIYAHRLANALARRGHRVTVVHSPTAYELAAGGPPPESYRDHPNVTVRALRTPLGALGLLAVQQTGRPVAQHPALKQWLEGERFDVIHYNNVSLLGGVGAFRYGRGLKLCTLTDHWLVCPMHTLWKFDREVCDKPTCIRCTIAGRRPPQVWRNTNFLRDEVRCIDAFLGPSLFTIRQHRTRGLEGTFVHLPQFQEDSASAPRAAPNFGRPYLLYAGRLENLKGVQIVIPALRLRPDVDFLIAGTGAMEPALRDLAHGAPNIRFLGHVEQADLAPLYASAIATVVPSLCYETFGLVVAESFAAGTPVIVNALGALEEIVGAHGGGLMYRDAHELGRAIDAMRGEAGLRERLAGEARAAFAREFSEDVHLERYLALVREMLARKRSGEPIAKAADQDSELRLAGRPVFVEPAAPATLRNGSGSGS